MIVFVSLRVLKLQCLFGLKDALLVILVVVSFTAFSVQFQEKVKPVVNGLQPETLFHKKEIGVS